MRISTSPFALQFIYKIAICYIVIVATIAAESRKSACIAEEVSLSKEQSIEALESVWNEKTAALKEELSKELDAKVIQAVGKKMKLLSKDFGEAAEGQKSLYISMHGGGNGPQWINDQQWKNQITLYQPEEGIYVAPRAPTNTWNLWHEAHIDDLFDRLILAHVLCRGVNPNKVYLMGYSAGGDGVFQIAPRMADRWAAVAMMAGHPNETRPEGLRNLPFALFMGEQDTAFKRNEIAIEWKGKLEKLAKEDIGGYDHLVRTYKTGHWMDSKDQECLPWLKARTRNPWPKKIVWVQDDRTHHRLYWLGLHPEDVRERIEIRAKAEGQTIEIESISIEDIKRLKLYLSDELLNLDLPVKVVWKDQTVFEGKVSRSKAALVQSLEDRLDRAMAAPVVLSVERP